MSAGKFERLKACMADVGGAFARAARLVGMRPRGRREAEIGTSNAPSAHARGGARSVVQLRNQMVRMALELQMAGKGREATVIFEQAIAQGGEAAETARILNLVANHHYRLGDYAKAEAKGRAALEMAQSCGAALEEGAAHCILGETAVKLDELDIAAEHFQEGADQFSRSGNLNATRQALDRLVQILGDHPDVESEQFYRKLALEIRQVDRVIKDYPVHQS